jgi:hypothetical protein
MKRKIYFFLPVLFLAIIMLASFGGDESSDYPGGSPAGYTGSPGDGQNCTSCHNGSASNVSGWITSDIPAEGYTPGGNYTITVTVSGSGTKGFEVSPQNASGTLLGTLTAGSGNHLTGSGKYVTQSSGSNSNPKVWTFQWTAPAAGTGEVTFYGAFTVNKPVTKLSTLVVQESTAQPLAVAATATPGTIFKGDSTHLDAIPTGGSGTYTYSWSSVPAGFASTLKNPYAKPEVNTRYTVSCFDGVTSVTSFADVTVQFHVGIETLATTHVALMPNPAGNFVKVSVNTETQASVILTEMTGKRLFTATVQPIRGTAVATIELSSYPEGIYLITVVTCTTSVSEKLIIRR